MESLLEKLQEPSTLDINKHNTASIQKLFRLISTTSIICCLTLRSIRLMLCKDLDINDSGSYARARRGSVTRQQVAAQVTNPMMSKELLQWAMTPIPTRDYPEEARYTHGNWRSVCLIECWHIVLSLQLYKDKYQWHKMNHPREVISYHLKQNVQEDYCYHASSTERVGIRHAASSGAVRLTIKSGQT